MGLDKKSARGLKICCIVTSVLLLLVIVVALILFLTILKPKQPKITTQAVTLEYIKLVPTPFLLNVTLGISVRIENPNYGSFKYETSKVYVSYRGDVVGEGPIEQDTIPARGKHDISTTVVVIGDKMISNPSFVPDSAAGCFNFTSSTTMRGKAKVLKFIKIKATTYTNCDISLFFLVPNATTYCSSAIKY